VIERPALTDIEIEVTCRDGGTATILYTLPAVSRGASRPR
jgi:hypothetical protein